MENVFKDADIGPDPYHVEPEQKGMDSSPFVDNAPLFQDEQGSSEEELRVHVPQEKRQSFLPIKSFSRTGRQRARFLWRKWEMSRHIPMQKRKGQAPAQWDYLHGVCRGLFHHPFHCHDLCNL